MKTLNLTEQQAKEVLKNTTDEGLKQIITSNFPNLVENKGLGRWEDLGEISGYFIDSWSEIALAESLRAEKDNKEIFKTEKQVLQVLAYAQLSQLAKASGMECTGNDCKKYFIFDNSGELSVDWYQNLFKGINLYFKTEDFANKFLEAHKELWKQFYGITV